LREVLEPLLKGIESLNERIKEYDARMEKIAKESYPQVALLKQVKGVGTQIALTYVLTLDDPAWSRISNALKRLGFRSHSLLAQLLSENLKSKYNSGSTIKFREALE
jgi:transposase